MYSFLILYKAYSRIENALIFIDIFPKISKAIATKGQAAQTVAKTLIGH